MRKTEATKSNSILWRWQLRICCTSEEFFPVPSGRLRRIYEVAKRLAKMHEVHIYCQQYSGIKEKVTDGIHIHEVGLPIFSPSSYLVRASAIVPLFLSLVKQSFDIINTNWLFPPIPSFLAAKLRETPIILTSDGILWHHVSRLGLSGYGVRETLLGCMMEDVDIGCGYDAYVAVSQGARRELISMGVEPEKVFVVYNGVDLEFYDSINVQEEVRPTVCYVGHLEQRKNALDLIIAFDQVLKAIPNAKLIIAGSGPLLEKARGLVQNLGVSKNVVFTGQADFRESAKIIKASHVLVLPSLIEGFGLVLAEANACYKPIVAYDVQNVREVVTDGINGFLVQPGNTDMLAERIIDTLVDKKLMRRLGNNGRRIVEEKFTWDKATERTLEVYHHVLQTAHHD